LPCYAFDPGDMRTDMHQQAFPGEDISDRPEPETVIPALLRLIGERPPSGRYRGSHPPGPGGPPGGSPPGGGPPRARGDPMRLAASQPPEARGLGRDGVRLLVATPDGMVRA